MKTSKVSPAIASAYCLEVSRKQHSAGKPSGTWWGGTPGTPQGPGWLQFIGQSICEKKAAQRENPGNLQTFLFECLVEDLSVRVCEEITEGWFVSHSQGRNFITNRAWVTVLEGYWISSGKKLTLDWKRSSPTDLHNQKCYRKSFKQKKIDTRWKPRPTQRNK